MPADDVVAWLLAERGVSGDEVRLRVENVLGGRRPVADGVDRALLPSPEQLRLGGTRDRAVGRGRAGRPVRRRGRSDRERYLELLAVSVPERYGNDVHRIVYGPGASCAFARVTEHSSTRRGTAPGGDLRLRDRRARRDHEGRGVLAVAGGQRPEGRWSPGALSQGRLTGVVVVVVAGTARNRTAEVLHDRGRPGQVGAMVDDPVLVVRTGPGSAGRAQVVGHPVGD